MNISRQFGIGLILGVMLGFAVFYGYSQSIDKSSIDSRLTELQNQMRTIQNQLNSLSSLSPYLSPTPLLTSSPSPTISSSPEPAEDVNAQNVYASGSPGDYIIFMTLINKGTATATLNPSTVFANGVLISNCSSATTPVVFNPTELPSGGMTSIASVELKDTDAYNYITGLSVDIMIQTASGSQCQVGVILP